MLPYGSGICCYAFLYIFLFLLLFSIPLYIYTFLKSGIDKSTEWSTIPACPSLMCFFNRGDTEGTNSSKFFVFDVCVCFVLCKCVYMIDFVVLNNFWFDDLRAE